MSYYEVNNEKHFIFGQGGGELVSDNLLVPLISQIPIGQPKKGSNSIFASSEFIGIMYLNLARKLFSLSD